MILAIYHGTDMDGWTSASIVKKYFNSKNIYQIHFLPFNLTNEKQIIDCTNAYIAMEKQHHREPNIYMLDCTLNLNYLKTIAPYVTHIDHHKSVIENPMYQDIRKMLKGDYSAVKGIVQGETEPVQIAACELTWDTLFPDQAQPLFVHLAGRHDVWDKQDPRADEFNAFIRNPGSEFFVKKYHWTFMEPWFEKLYNDDFVTSICLPRGQVMLQYQRESWAAEARTGATLYYHPDGYQIAVANRSNVNSEYFTELCISSPQLAIGIVYTHKIRQSVITISFFTLNKSSKAAALEVMSEFTATEGLKILTKGGHLHACGCTISDECLPIFRTWLSRNNLIVKEKLLNHITKENLFKR